MPHIRSVCNLANTFSLSSSEMNWELMFTNVSSNSSNCTTGSCLYFTGRESNTAVTVRSATTRPLDLKIVQAVEPPHAHSSDTSCLTNETQMYNVILHFLHCTMASCLSF